MKYLKRINLKEINQENTRKEIKKEYGKGTNYYNEVNKHINNN